MEFYRERGFNWLIPPHFFHYIFTVPRISNCNDFIWMAIKLLDSKVVSNIVEIGYKFFLFFKSGSSAENVKHHVLTQYNKYISWSQCIRANFCSKYTDALAASTIHNI